MRHKDWKFCLDSELGDGFDVIMPKMPCSENAHFDEWSIWFSKIIHKLDDKIMLIGHSLGGLFLSKYLATTSCPKEIMGTILVATPFVSHQSDILIDFMLPNDLSNMSRQGGEIHIFHSKDDAVVPYEHALQYMEELLGSKLTTFEDRQHLNQTTFPELVETISRLGRNVSL